jgi:hypothetical protein
VGGVYIPGCCVGGAGGMEVGGAYIPGYCVVGGIV